MEINVLVPVADDTEEIEAVCIIDTLRRAGAEVTVASVMTTTRVRASRGVTIEADCTIDTCAGVRWDCIALPGGMPGAEHLRDCGTLTQLLKAQAREGRLYAAICASPVVILQHHGLLESRAATCHPGCAGELEDRQALEEHVVIDGNCITSRGPGTALEFSLTLVELLYGREKALEIASAMVVSSF